MKEQEVTSRQQLDEIKWIKNLANKFTEPARGQNTAGRERLAQTQERLFGEIQNYLGMRDMSLSDLTPVILARFLNSNGIEVTPDDIPADPSGIVNKSTIRNIVRDLSIKSLTGEPLTYTNPSASTQQQSVLKPTRTAPPASSGSDTSDYLTSWIEKIKSAVDDDAKADLARELAVFLSQKTKSPDGAREVADTLATQATPKAEPTKASEPTPSAPRQTTKATPKAGKPKTSSKAENPTSAKVDIPKMPTGTTAAKPEPEKSVTSQAAKGIEAGFKSLATGAADAGRKRVSDLIQKGNPPTYKNEKAIAAAKADPTLNVVDNPDGSVTVTGIQDKESGTWTGQGPAQPKKTPAATKKTAPATKKPAEPAATKKTAAPKEKPAAEPTKPSATQTVVKGGKKITMPAMPTGKKESIQKAALAIKEGKKLPSGLKINKNDYTYFVKILETLDLTIKDLGLWRVLKESTDQYVILQTR